MEIMDWLLHSSLTPSVKALSSDDILLLFLSSGVKSAKTKTTTIGKLLVVYKIYLKVDS